MCSVASFLFSDTSVCFRYMPTSDLISHSPYTYTHVGRLGGREWWDGAVASARGSFAENSVKKR